METKLITVKINKDSYKKLQIIAINNDKSLKEYISGLLDKEANKKHSRHTNEEENDEK